MLNKVLVVIFIAQTAKQLLPLAEEYEMFKLRRNCENVLHTAYEQLRKEYRLGQIPRKHLRPQPISCNQSKDLSL